MLSLASVERLCTLDHPYQNGSAVDRLFADAMREITALHVQRTPGYAQWLSSQSAEIDRLPDLDWRQLPPLFANYFKRHQVLSESGQDALELTSSGTTGQKSRMRYDERSMGAAQGMVDRVFRHYGWHTPDTACNYLLLSYEPVGAVTLGTTYTDQFLCKYAPVERVVYALRHTGTGHEFDPFGVIHALEAFAEHGSPVRIFGFPAFLWFTLERMRALGRPSLTLHPDSLVFFGGGWKTHANLEIPRLQLYARITEQLGIPGPRCRDGYGSVEHCVPYVECAHHHFHVPVYARACIRDTRTFAVLGYGRPGFIQFVSPFISSSPAHSIVMNDLATMHPGAECGCGIETDWFALVGRAGSRAARSCAIAASELIREH